MQFNSCETKCAIKLSHDLMLNFKVPFSSLNHLAPSIRLFHKKRDCVTHTNSSYAVIHVDKAVMAQDHSNYMLL
jgi:hypothetical protein